MGLRCAGQLRPSTHGPVGFLTNNAPDLFSALNMLEEFGRLKPPFIHFKLDFDEAAINALVDQSLEDDKTIRAICERKFRDFHHGLTLISRNTGQTVFPITESVIKNAEKELSDWVVRSYRAQSSDDQS